MILKMKTTEEIINQLNNIEIRHGSTKSISLFHKKNWYSEEEWNAREQKVKDTVIKRCHSCVDCKNLLSDLGIE
jgi:hypothetical protein